MLIFFSCVCKKTFFRYLYLHPSLTFNPNQPSLILIPPDSMDSSGQLSAGNNNNINQKRRRRRRNNRVSGASGAEDTDNSVTQPHPPPTPNDLVNGVEAPTDNSIGGRGAGEGGGSSSARGRGGKQPMVNGKNPGESMRRIVSFLFVLYCFFFFFFLRSHFEVVF